MKIKKKLLAASLLAVLGCGIQASSQAADLNDPWLVRIRAVQLDMANKSEPIGGVGNANTIHVEDKLIPEVDISYFFTPNWAAELVLTVPQKHEVTVEDGGTVTRLGTFKHLPPTLSLQYHFSPGAAVQPYVGVGVNYTKFSSVNLSSGGTPLRMENDSFGLAFGAGVDFPITKDMSFNLDIKKLQIRSDVMAGGSKISEVKADPLLIGIGLGWKF
jgi:outer membrane protein